ncbi:DUF402 domain-containing protein [Macrococcus hajekii]|uniref:DUF402 domain-containing protein n=1 Tax=Macrococcus hajekii TaxID=198482 RepID=A0A4R6BIX9_9STAP|nr:DUF402 domain-containing protein [Macrococcus hajekii]TDM01557.1 DUF402 domain-containing protein [Macrococcus hajekii]GGB00968.1 hypothetical protein GCM10007190_06320 [Macrococcus hajekii]
MKTKYIDKRYWRRLQKKEYKELRIEDSTFDGIVGLVTMKKVKSPLQVEVVGQLITVADVGYEWLQLLPKDKDYSITAMYDSAGKPVQYYIDINECNILEMGEARTCDMFLDILVLPTGEYELVDEADIKRALSKGEITQSQFEAAYKTANELMQRISTDFIAFAQKVEYCRQKITPML